MTLPLILDIDAEADSTAALALAAGAPDAALLGVCTVFGRQPAARTAAKAHALLKALAPGVPVHAGCEGPMVRRLFAPDGQATALPAPSGTPAALFYIRALAAAAQPVTVVTTGPLTNLALALLARPGLQQQLARVVVAGGGDCFTDATPAAEAAIWADPEAAQTLLQCGTEVLFVALDAAHAAALPPGAVAGLGRSHGAATFARAAAQCPNGQGGACLLHGPLAVAAALRPGVLRQVEAVHCQIGLQDFSTGQTLIDRRLREHPPENARFAFAADGAVLLAVLRQCLAKEVC